MFIAMVLPVKGLIKHFLLISMLIFHSTWGSVMAMQMQTFPLQPEVSERTSAVDSMHKKVVSDNVTKIDSTNDNQMSSPCPHHSKSMLETSIQKNIQVNYSMMNCNSHDCSNCNCVHVLSSLPSFMVMMNNVHLNQSSKVTFVPTIFPDSPSSSILRPPIS